MTVTSLVRSLNIVLFPRKVLRHVRQQKNSVDVLAAAQAAKRWLPTPCLVGLALLGLTASRTSVGARSGLLHQAPAPAAAAWTEHVAYESRREDCHRIPFPIPKHPARHTPLVKCREQIVHFLPCHSSRDRGGARFEPVMLTSSGPC